jgi:hypothetical protein
MIDGHPCVRCRTDIAVESKKPWHLHERRRSLESEHLYAKLRTRQESCCVIVGFAPRWVRTTFRVSRGPIFHWIDMPHLGRAVLIGYVTR